MDWEEIVDAGSTGDLRNLCEEKPVSGAESDLVVHMHLEFSTAFPELSTTPGKSSPFGKGKE